MVNVEQWAVLVDRIMGYHPGADQALLERLRLFLSGLSDQEQVACRIGELDTPFEPLAVAGILVDLRLDVASIAAGLLVDSLAAGWTSLQRIREDFGEDVAFLVERVSRISLLPSRPKNTSQAEEFRKMILSMAKDIRVILVRLAICVWRMRHLAARAPAPLPVPRQAIQDIVEIQAPIAHRLGIYWIKNELEDLAFRLLDFDAYEALKKEVAKRRKGGADLVQQVVALLKKHLRKHGISGQVLGREKHLWSIHHKLLQKNITLDEMYDIIGYRIIVKKKSDCYRVLGMIHGEFPPVPGRFKDYIALPKSNGYQSLHTVVIGPFGERIEIQIRNEKMHQVAESGVAAHWNYKERAGGLANRKHVAGSATTGYEWLQRMLENHKKEDDVGKFVENVKIDLFPNEIYLFTPAGDVITLPVGATPIDFAYAVHSEVGDHCQGAKVNGRMVPLHTMLHTGDQVSILTSKAQRPNGAWLRFVVTSRAKYRINRWVKIQERERDIVLGRSMLEREVRKAGRGAVLGEKLLRKAVELFRLPDEAELMVRVARARLSAVQVALALFPPLPAERGEAPEGEAAARGSEEVTLKALPARTAVRAARCCGPVPGDAIVGIITTGRGIMIHAVGCPNLTPLVAQPERWMDDLEWPVESETRYRTRLRVMVRNRREIITLVTQAVTSAKGGVASVHVWDRDRDPCVLIMLVEVAGIEELNAAMNHLRALKEVFNVDRIRGG
ncbi:MAG: bifunctional (p)ppGpp synthetase/guanosine-3',5'-bis(diphosphate) 3'-pyrophosphohydrolase [Magnetococcales bacterium]|nr:bifunctional (p)ppGpp synthetase/guanosine-3',5'-bis(diphosphate) 3'-pyrophosphohydrolase [Magnetococcales bacterium]